MRGHTCWINSYFESTVKSYHSSITVSVAEWLESEGSVVRLPIDTSIFISSQLREAHTNEIKHDIHPDWYGA